MRDDVISDALFERVRRNVAEWSADLQKKIEVWCSEQGYSPLKEKGALSLIDELKTRGVKRFKGLGIEVEL